jgi:uridine kinase
MRLVRYAEVAAEILARPPRLGPVRLVAVDGPSGAGKTTFATRLAGAVRATGAMTEVVNTDDLLDGWDDMLTFWPRLDGWVLTPLRNGEPGRYRRYDWHAGAFGTDWHAVPVPDVLILEGVTSARGVIRPELSFLVWVSAPRDLRIERSVARDGEATRPELLEWTYREDAHFTSDRPAEAADVRVAGVSVESPSGTGSGFLGVISGSTGLTG